MHRISNDFDFLRFKIDRYVYDVCGFLRFWLANFVFVIGSGRMSDKCGNDIPPCFSAGSHPVAFQSSIFLTPP